MNCADPANTNRDIAIVPPAESPLVLATAPKMMPKGMAPTISGNASLTPAQNSPPRVGWMDCDTEAPDSRLTGGAGLIFFPGGCINKVNSFKSTSEARRKKDAQPKNTRDKTRNYRHGIPLPGD